MSKERYWDDIYLYYSNFSQEDNFLSTCMLLYLWNLICRCKQFMNSWLPVFEISYDIPQQCTWNNGCDYTSSVSELPNFSLQIKYQKRNWSDAFYTEILNWIWYNDFGELPFAELKFRLKLFYNYKCTVEFWFWANFCESSMQLWIGWFECLSSVDDVWNYVSLMPCCLWWLKVSILNACLVIWIKNFYLWKE